MSEKAEKLEICGPSALWHLATEHGWRQMWLFGMRGEQAADIHRMMYRFCPWRPSR